MTQPGVSRRRDGVGALMKRFKNILVGVDLCSGDLLVSDDLAPPTREAIDRALWLAKENRAELCFFSSLDVPLRTQQIISEHPDSEESVLSHAKQVLSKWVEAAEREGVSSKFRVAFGKSWVQIIREVLKAQHDLVIVGSRKLGPVRRFLLGSTGTKLLRKCPCPVWVTQPQAESRISSVLVATDLTPVSDLAMDLGASMAKQHEAALYVLHVLEYPEEFFLRQSRRSAELIKEYRKEFKDAAEERLRAQLHRAAFSELTEPPQVTISEGPVAAEILSQIERHKAQLLVMGTVGRGGVEGVLVGNTAETLLREIPCSVLAVKPEDFESSISLS